MVDRKKMSIVSYKSERRKNENLKKEGKMRIIILISIYTVHFAILKMITKFEILAPIGAEKSVTEISIGEKKNEQIKGPISNMWLFFCYIIQLITIKLCTTFQNPNPSSC